MTSQTTGTFIFGGNSISKYQNNYLEMQTNRTQNKIPNDIDPFNMQENSIESIYDMIENMPNDKNMV